MAVTFAVTPVKTHVLGDRKEVVADVVATGTPTAGGDSLTGTALGLDLELTSVSVAGNASNAGNTAGAVVAVDHTAAAAFNAVTVTFYVQGTAGATNTMVALTASATGLKFRVTAHGKGKGLF